MQSGGNGRLRPSRYSVTVIASATAERDDGLTPRAE